jgi:hypothetical protein
MTADPRAALARDETISSAVRTIGAILVELPDDAARAQVWARAAAIVASPAIGRAAEVPTDALVALLRSRVEPWSSGEVADALYGGRREIARVALNRAKGKGLVVTTEGGHWRAKKKA